MEILKVANVCIARKADELVKLEVGEIASPCITDDAASELGAKVQIVYRFVLERLLDKIECVHQVSDTSNLLIFTIWSIEHQSEILPKSAIAAKVDYLLENVLRSQQPLKRRERLLGFGLGPVMVNIEA